MKRILPIFFATVAASIASPMARAAILPATGAGDTQVIASDAGAGVGVINDLAGPSDYGEMTPAASYSLENLTVGDTRQGQVADCWLLATLASIIHQRPDTLAQNYAVQPDGTANVTFFRSGEPITYHVTNGINTWWGDPGTSNDDSNGDAAGMIMQKAYAAFRTTPGTILNLGWGLPSESITAFGWTSSVLPFNTQAIINAWAEGGIVEVDTGYLTPPGGVANHTYSVWSVDPVAGTVVLRSPWGGGYAQSEYLTVDTAWLEKYSNFIAAGLPGGASPLSVPEPASVSILGGAVVLLLRKRRAV